jgi:hypothetical protein
VSAGQRIRATARETEDRKPLYPVMTSKVLHVHGPVDDAAARLKSGEAEARAIQSYDAEAASTGEPIKREGLES